MSRKKVLIMEILIILSISLVAISIMLISRPCAHGHHTGTCGREYRHMVGKVSTISVCPCKEDHY